MYKVKMHVSPAFTVGQTDPKIFGSFIEHIGRAVYGGVYEPAHPAADEYGFRNDVSELIKEMNVPIIRYPGGNFVSGYSWEDGIGPRESRPRRADLAWKTTETNQCGTDDFSAYCERIGSEVLMTVNLGTAGASEAKNLVEYCNLPEGTYYSDLRRKNGREKPYGIKYWCLGNEMDGEWQIGHKEAHEYGRLAHETSKMMKQVDPSIQTVLCGSSSPDMRTFGEWEREVLKVAYDSVDMISLHRYYSNRSLDTPEFVACPLDAEKFINDVIAFCDAEKAVRRSKKTIMLSFDEWNVWNHTNDVPVKEWSVAPPILEESYTVEDALLVGGFLITLLRHCDRVRIACLAQLVNVIAPIMTKNGGGAWRQTTFYPFADCSNNGRGTVYDVRIDTPSYRTRFGEAGYTDGVAVTNDRGETVIFAVNRSLDEEAEFTCDLNGIADGNTAVHTFLTGDPKACNSMENPGNVRPETAADPELRDGRLAAVLPPFSWNMITIR